MMKGEVNELSLTERDKKALYILIAFMIAIFYFRFVFTSDLGRLQELQVQKDSLNAELEGLKTKIISFKKQQHNVENVYKSYIELSRKMPVNQNEKFVIVDTKTLLGTYSEVPDSLPIISRKKISDNTYTVGSKANIPIRYNKFKELLGNAENYDVIYDISNISLSKGEGDMVNAIFDISFYSYEDEEAPVREWKNFSHWGNCQDIFFATPVSSMPKNTKVLPIDEDKQDFLLLLNTLNAPTGCVLLEKLGSGKSIFGKNNMIERVEVHLEGEKGRYGYAIIAGEKRYPDSDFEIFKPNSQDIVVLISSLPRQYEDDSNVVIAHIDNKTDKRVVVYIKNDDDKKPRVHITKSGEDIYVFKD